MTEQNLYAAIGLVEEELLARTEQPVRRSGRLFWIAAILAAALLLGAGASGYGRGIGDWFAARWALLTGQEAPAEQTTLIARLTQPLDLRQTVGDVTVCLDSATVGEDSFFLLLRVEGLELYSGYDYGFHGLSMGVSPDPLEAHGGMASSSLRYHGTDDRGAALLLLEYDYLTRRGDLSDARPLEITLTLWDFCRSPHQLDRQVLAAGPWSFTFTLERNAPPQTVTLPEAQVLMLDRTANAQVPVTVTDLELTNTGLRYRYDYRGGRLILRGMIRAVLKNGRAIFASGGTGVVDEATGLLQYACQWEIPLDLSQLRGFQIGDTFIPLP